MNKIWQELKDTYSGQSVFVTGHTGFMGGWLTYTLQLLGANVTGYSLAPTYDNNLYDLLDLEHIHQSIIGDIRDKGGIMEAVEKAKPAFYFHLAAQPIVKTSYKFPSDTYSSNVMGTLNVLESIAAQKQQVTSVLITTDKVYQNNELGKPFTEDDPMGGHDMYSSSKACCEILIESYVKSFLHKDKIDQHQKSVSTCRAGNVFGGGDWAEYRLVPDIARSICAGKPIEIRSPEAIRPWQHVIEPVFAYLYLAMKQAKDPKRYADTYNLGPEERDTLTVKDLLEKAIATWGKGEFVINKDPNAPHEAKLLMLDCQKVKSALHWKPQINVDQALEMTIQWYKHNNEDPKTSKAFTKKQIEEYAAQLDFSAS